jgi:hypothetical protein
MPETKLIAGRPHHRRKCLKCGQPFWARSVAPMRLLCGDCYSDGTRSAADPRCGGGKRRCDKDTHSGG